MSDSSTDKKKKLEKGLKKLVVIVIVVILLLSCGVGIVKYYKDQQKQFEVLSNQVIAESKTSTETIEDLSTKFDKAVIPTNNETSSMYNARSFMLKLFADINDRLLEASEKDKIESAELWTRLISMYPNDQDMVNRMYSEVTFNYDSEYDLILREIYSADDYESLCKKQFLDWGLIDLTLATDGRLDSYCLNVSASAKFVSTYAECKNFAQWWFENMFSKEGQAGRWISMRVSISGYEFYQTVGRLNSGLQPICTTVDPLIANSMLTFNRDQELLSLLSSVGIDTTDIVSDSSIFGGTKYAKCELNSELTATEFLNTFHSILINEIENMESNKVDSIVFYIFDSSNKVVFIVDNGIIETYNYYTAELGEISNISLEGFSDEVTDDFGISSVKQNEFYQGLYRLYQCHEYFGKWYGPVYDIIKSYGER